MPRIGRALTNTDPQLFASTGTPGLDDILMGGLARSHPSEVELATTIELILQDVDTLKRLRVVKYRGSQFRGGDHDYPIKKGGLEVFSRLHERTIREFAMGADGIRVGEALRNFRGVLTGVPVYEGANEPLLETGGTA